MTNILIIAIGGAAGALLRHWLSGGAHLLLGRGFPYGTLTVNVLGALVAGVLYVLFIERLPGGVAWRLGLVVGLLGAFTTFSAFSVETLSLIENGEPFKAGFNILLNVGLCLLACWVGMLVARQI